MKLLYSLIMYLFSYDYVLCILEKGVSSSKQVEEQNNMLVISLCTQKTSTYLVLSNKTENIGKEVKLSLRRYCQFILSLNSNEKDWPCMVTSAVKYRALTGNSAMKNKLKTYGEEVKWLTSYTSHFLQQTTWKMSNVCLISVCHMNTTTAPTAIGKHENKVQTNSEKFLMYNCHSNIKSRKKGNRKIFIQPYPINSNFTSAIASTSVKVEGEIQQLCQMFNINPYPCNCSLFRMSYGNRSEELCDVFESIDENMVSDALSVSSNFPYLLTLTCQTFDLLDANCSCASIQISSQNLTKTFCKASSSGSTGIFIDSLEKLCELYGIAPVNCSCELEMTMMGENAITHSACDFVEKHFNYHSKYSHMYASVALAASLLGITGNSLVLVVAFKTKSELPGCKKLIAALAVCDLVFAIFQSIHVTPNFWGNEWIYGLFLCKLLKACEQLGTSAAIGIILIICIERYVGITKPFGRGLPEMKLCMFLGINLLVSVASIIPLFMFVSNKEKAICRVLWPNPISNAKIYHIVIAVIFFVLPLAIITVLYIRIINTLRRNALMVCKNIIADNRVRKTRIIESRRAIAIMMGVVTAFFLCVLPNHAVIIYFDFIKAKGDYIEGDSIELSTYYYLQYLARLPYPFHVAINPVIYSLVDSKWRQDVKTLIFKKRDHKISVSTTVGFNLSRNRNSAATIYETTVLGKSVTNIPSRTNY